MSLTPGSRLGAYDVLAMLGEGGMGEVYRGRDGALQRDVALKVLPVAFLTDPDRLMRFRREAQVLAALNHPNIAAIYGFETAGDTPALVLELVEGPTLADRLASGPLPLDDAVAIAGQIADALESAHAQGIVHRDLKPANIKLRPDGTVKVLDFGLAKALDSNVAATPPDLSPTITSPALTRAGIILGTAAYMSPEQARGRAADARSDIWAFGVVLFEMLSGQRVFKGDDIADTLAAVLRADPPWAALPAHTPPSIRRLLRRCLQREVRRRLQHIGDARLELADAAIDEATPIPLSTAPPRRTLWPVAVAAIAAAAIVAWFAGARSAPSPEPAVTRFALRTLDLAPRVIGSGSSVTLSPDGRSMVYVVSGASRALERRRLDDLNPESIRGTEGGSRPFFSPDGQWLAFFADNQLKKVRADGGTPVTVADVSPTARGAWGSDDTIVLARPGLWTVPASGGTPQVIVEAGDAVGQFAEPHFLPGGTAVLVQNRRPPTEAYIEAIELASGQRHRLVEGSSPVLAPTGDLLFVRDGKLWGVRFDAAALAVVGQPIALVDSPGFRGGDGGEGGFAMSRDGTLAYLAGEGSSAMVWLDRTGAVSPASADPLRLRNPRLSPDGSLVVANGNAAADLWLFDFARGSRLRLTTDGFNRGSAWTADGARIAYFSAPATPQLGASLTQDLYAVPVGGGAPARLLERPGPQWADSWSPDGHLIFDDGPGFSRDLWVLPIGGEPRALVATRFNERAGTFSRDGASFAFVSDESGRDEVYVQPFPGPGPKVAVSTGGGLQPVWSRDGRELFYREGEAMMAVAVTHRPFTAATPRRLFAMPSALYGLDPFVADYDVAPDGRFLSVRREEAAEIHVVLHWAEELRRALGR